LRGTSTWFRNFLGSAINLVVLFFLNRNLLLLELVMTLFAHYVHASHLVLVDQLHDLLLFALQPDHFTDFVDRHHVHLSLDMNLGVPAVLFLHGQTLLSFLHLGWEAAAESGLVCLL